MAKTVWYLARSKSVILNEVGHYAFNLVAGTLAVSLWLGLACLV